MKAKILIALSAAALLTAGCVETVGGHKTAGVPFVRDTVEARYEGRPIEQVYSAAQEIIKSNGTIVEENIVYGQTNALNNIARVIVGKVNQCSVWVRVLQREPTITDVSVQARTQNGAPDRDLAYQIDKQIALRLVR